MEIPMSFELWERVPRHPDWKWEYSDSAAQLSYRPKPVQVRRRTAAPVADDRRHDVRLVPGADDGVREFLAAFWRTEDPYRTVDEPGPWIDDGPARSFARLAEPGSAVAEEDGEIIGVVLLERPQRDETAPYLSWLAVRPGFRHDGVGTALLAAITASLQAAGVEYLDSGVSVANRASVAWHWRNGFEALPDRFAAYGWDARRH